VLEPIDPLAAVIAYLRDQVVLAALVTDRIAARHGFAEVADPSEVGRGWPTPARALTLRYAGVDGAPDTAARDAQERVRLEARCYGDGPLDAARVANLLTEVCRQFVRRTVPLQASQVALIYALWPLDAVTAEYDPDIRCDVARLTLRAWVSRTPL